MELCFWKELILTYLYYKFMSMTLLSDIHVNFKEFFFSDYMSSKFEMSILGKSKKILRLQINQKTDKVLFFFGTNEIC